MARRKDSNGLLLFSMVAGLAPVAALFANNRLPRGTENVDRCPERKSFFNFFGHSISSRSLPVEQLRRCRKDIEGGGERGTTV